MIKKMLAALLCCPMALCVKAQQKVFPPLVPGHEVRDQLFQVPDDELNIHFSISIGKGEYLLVEATRITAWDAHHSFDLVMDKTALVMDQYRDSLQDGLSSKRINIHIPVDNEPLIASFQQSFAATNMLSIGSTETSALKINMDTVRIVRNVRIREKNQDTLRLQYTFLMKDVSRIGRTINDPAWRSRTQQLVDSVVAVYRKQWRKPDAWFHQLYVNHDPKASPGSKQQLNINKRVSEVDNIFVGNVLSLNGGFGLNVVRNTICPNIEAGLSYYYFSDREHSLFTRLSVNSFMRYEPKADQSFEIYGTSFVNAELGVQSNTNNGRVPFYALSMGFGYKLLTKERANRDPSMPGNMYKLFFNYGISKTIMITPEMVTNFKMGNKYNGWIGLGINFRLF